MSREANAAGDGPRLLRLAATILLVDWPSREVPDTLARAGMDVVAQEGPGVYRQYRIGEDGGVHVVHLDQQPARADLVYAFRPLDELPAIIELATSVAARGVWLEGALAPADAARARQAVESAGLVYVDRPSITDAARALVTSDGQAQARKRRDK